MPSSKSATAARRRRHPAVGDAGEPDGRCGAHSALPDHGHRVRHRRHGGRCWPPLLRGRAALLRPTPASLALGIYGLFGYHALYFAALKLAPPAEASLITSLWALLTVLFSGLLPGHRLRAAHIVGALLGLAAATLLVWDKLGAEGDAAGHRLGFALAFACALVWSSYSVASRLLAAVPSESIAVAVPRHVRAGLRSAAARSSAG